MNFYDDPAKPDPLHSAVEWDSELADIHRRSFNFFWECTDHETGLTPDRWPSASPCSVAAVGFALTAYVAGAAQGYISRTAAAERVRNTLRTFCAGPQGADAEGCMGYRGFFYHFLDLSTGLRDGNCEVSTVDSSILFLGALTAAAYFDAADPIERQVRTSAVFLYERADWTYFLKHPSGRIGMGWTPEFGQLEWGWEGYNESMFVYLLAMASPTFSVPAESWEAWCSTYPRSWGTHFGQTHLGFSPMFGHQYSHIWFDFRGIADRFMRDKGSDYFENSVKATLAQRTYAIANPLGFEGYGTDLWGLTACDGPGRFVAPIGHQTTQCHAYHARGAGLSDGEHFDDGTIAPSAAIASINFVPAACKDVIRNMRARYGAAIYQNYGFKNAFNPSLAAVLPSRSDEGRGSAWVADDYLGIEHGASLAMLENYRLGLFWSTLKASALTGPIIRRGLLAAGFQVVSERGAWLATSFD